MAPEVIAEPRSASFRALGTTAVVAVDEAGALGEAEVILRGRLEAIDRACSRFRDDSELTRVNEAAGDAVRVSPLFIEALDVALRAAAVTDGDVDPTVGRAMGELGYDRDFSLVPGAAPQLRVRIAAAPGWRTIRVDRAHGTVTVPRGVWLDLGATAKAWAADRSARAIHDATGAGVLVGLGGDIALCGPAPGEGWPIRVSDDHRDSSAECATIRLREGGLATSGTTVRRWRSGGVARHHILDPRRGAPAAEVWRTVSVAAGNCADANVASTAAIVRGDRAPLWLEGAGLPARLVRPDGAVVHVGGWPEPIR